jgi:hypothetical protein
MKLKNGTRSHIADMKMKFEDDYSWKGQKDITCPCHDCKKRHIGCHDDCEEYLLYKKLNKKRKGK